MHFWPWVGFWPCAGLPTGIVSKFVELTGDSVKLSGFAGVGDDFDFESVSNFLILSFSELLPAWFWSAEDQENPVEIFWKLQNINFNKGCSKDKWKD